MNEAPHLFQCLTWAEFKTCWAIAFCSRCDGYENSFDLERYASPGLEGQTGDWMEIFRRVIRLLHLRHEYSFTGILPLPDGEIIARMVEKNNIAFVAQFRVGAIPDPPSALEMALEDKQLLDCGLNLEPLRACLDDVKSDMKDMIAKYHKEGRMEFEVQKEAIALGQQIIDEQLGASKETIH